MSLSYALQLPQVKFSEPQESPNVEFSGHQTHKVVSSGSYNILRWNSLAPTAEIHEPPQTTEVRYPRPQVT